jgi:hypothetical protein
MYRPKGLSRVYKVDPTLPPLIMEKTGTPYQGEYYHYDPVEDTYFAGLPNQAYKERISISGGIVEEQSLSVEQIFVSKNEYDFLRKDDEGYRIRATLALPTYDTTPSQEEYLAGVYTRYFAEQKSTNTIHELSREVYSDLANKSDRYHHPSYLIGECLWFLRGPVADQNINGYIVSGAAAKNSYTIARLEELLPNIRTYLTDPTQFVE